MHSISPAANTIGLEARFARAARHSRFVRVLRVGIPAIVATTLAGVVALSLFNPFRVVANIPFEVDNLVVSGSRVTMQAPHLAGFSPDGRPYDLVAQSAVQDVKNPDIIELVIPHGTMQREDGSTVTVDSREGTFNNKAQLLDLRDKVKIKTTDGYEMRLNQAQVDIAAGTVATDDGVDVAFEGGRVKSDRLRVMDRGDAVRFEKNVVMDLDASPAKPASPVAPSEAAKPQPKRPTAGPRASAK